MGLLRRFLLNLQLNRKHTILFVLLNLVDLALTLLSIHFGSLELNPILLLGSLPGIKILLTTTILLLLLTTSKGHLLKLLNIGLVVIVVYNGIALWSWI